MEFCKLSFAGAKIIDATDKFIVPGGIDSCTNLRNVEDLADDMNSGTRAALAGGTTTIVDLVIPEKDQSLMDAVNAWKEDIEESGTTDNILDLTVCKKKGILHSQTLRNVS